MFSSILLQMDGNVLGYVDNIYALIGLGIIMISYLITTIYNKKHSKKQIKEIIKSFEEQNDKIIEKIDTLREIRNVLDVQGSMDVIYLTLTKSKNEIIYVVTDILNSDGIEQKSMFISKKSMIFEKVNNAVNSNFDDDIIILSRIYHNNIKLSYFISEFNRAELSNDITHKIISLSDKSNVSDVIDFVDNKYNQMISNIQIKLNK